MVGWGPARASSVGACVMPKTNGAHDKNQRSRRKATQAELSRKAERRAKAAEKKRLAAQNAANAARRGFFSAGGASNPGSSSAAAPGAEGDISDCSDEDESCESEEGDSDNAAGAGTDGDQAAEDQEEDSGEARREARPRNVEATLDDEVDEERTERDAAAGVMGMYRKAVFDRLHSETTGEASRNALEAKWLLSMLNEEGSEWWLRATRARSICKKLGLEYGEPAYYRDILVWLPDERWGAEAMPPCVHCDSAAQVGVHGYRDDHFGRRICGLESHYFIISRRYICHCCENKAKATKQAAEAAGMRMAEAVVAIVAIR